GPAEREPRLDRIFGELREDLLHRPAQVDMHHLTAELGGIDLGQIFRRIVLELFEIDALARDLAERLAVGRARYPEPARKRSAVAGKADPAPVVAEIFAAELRAHAQRLRELMHLLFYREVAEGVAVLGAGRREVVEIAAGGELDRLHRQFGRRAADDD